MDIDRNLEQIPLSEFDPDRKAIVEPSCRQINFKLPEYCILPLYKSLPASIAAEGKIKKIHTYEYPFWYDVDLLELNYHGTDIIVVIPGFSAAVVAHTIESLIAWGCRKFIACGSCGVLSTELKNGEVIIPATAVRDEGLSYHYLPPSRTINMDPTDVEKLASVLQKHHINYRIGKTWTTDAPYRETRSKIDIRRKEGCISVEMECSAFLAVTQFRNVFFGQYLSASDDISGDEWDIDIDHGISVQEKLFWLSAEACVLL